VYAVWCSRELCTLSHQYSFTEETKEKAGLLWQNAVAYEWNKAAVVESEDGSKYPFILCHRGGDLSGYKRKLALAAAIDYSEEEEGMHFRTLYNSDDFLCVYGQLLASVAAGIKGDEFIVQPLVPSMKFMQHSIDTAKSEVENTNTGENNGHVPTLDVILCPGVAIDKSNVTGLVDERLDISDWVISKLVTSTVDEETSSDISDAYYLTSDAYINSNDAEGDELTERARRWKDLLDEYQSSGVCDDTYVNRLTWTLVRTTDPETSSSLLEIQYNSTGKSDQDEACMLTLSLAITAHPNVCSLEVRQGVKTNNKIAQWLTQSELEDKRPFFDSGLKGEGQVVAVSDTGIDLDNCYFWDKDQSAGLSMNLNARKVVQYTPYVDNADYAYGHGTHTAGTIAGKRAIDGATESDGAADGIAPEAKIAFADVGDETGALVLPSDNALLSTGRPNAKIHSVSWGSGMLLAHLFYTSCRIGRLRISRNLFCSSRSRV
jgi:subtilisin family serine protease